MALKVDGSVGAIVQLKSETDFTAKNGAFLTLVQKLADAVLSDGEGAIDSLTQAIEDLKLVTKENIEVGTVVRFEAAPGNMGNILKGHGGVLDRFDALLFTLPATYYIARFVIL